LEGLVFFIVSLGLLLFLPVWTVNYWQAWVFLAVFSVLVLAITLYLMQNDSKLLERRVNAGAGAEKEKIQKIIQSIASIAFIALFLISSIDHRLGWSFVPTYAVIVGDILVVLGLLVVFLVFKVNTFTSAIIETSADQKVISTGPYAIVRHPMYAGAFVMLIGVPFALGSYWGLFAVILLIVAIIFRLLDEEKFLVKNLTKYSDYRKKVKYRLVPFLW